LAKGADDGAVEDDGCAIFEEGDGGLDGEEGTGEIDADDVLKDGLVGAAGFGLSGDSCVGEDDVEMAEVFGDPGEEIFAGG